MQIRRISALRAGTADRETVAQMTAPLPPEQKARISAYLRAFGDAAFTSQPVYDLCTGELVRDADNAVTDGVYTWYWSEIYHFERYDIGLFPQFVEYVLTT